MLIQEVTDLATDGTLADAQEIGAQLQSAMEDLYYAHRMGNPNPTVKQNIDLLQKSIRSFNQELNSMGYKYAPTVPGLVAKMGTRFVEDDVDEGFRVANQQIRGTQNRAQSAYYPTNVKPHVPKLDKPLTDQELARLSQLAGLKTNK